MDTVERLLGPRPYTDPPPWPEIPSRDSEWAAALTRIRDEPASALGTAQALGRSVALNQAASRSLSGEGRALRASH